MKPCPGPLSSGAHELLDLLEVHGALRLNSTPRFPNVIDLGAGWPEVMELVSAHLCFVSRLVDGRTTYLSIPVFEACSALVSDRPPTRDSDIALLDLLEGGPLAVDEIAALLPADPATVRQSLSRLQERLLVTVFGPGRTLNPNWDTYVWATRRTWESHCPVEIGRPEPEAARSRLEACLGPYMSPRRISRIIDGLSGVRA